MSFKLKISPTFDQMAKLAKHKSAIRKLEDACDEAVLQFVNNPKPDREKILDWHLAKAEMAMQFHIREINKLESKADYDPTKEGASLVKKSRDKISNPKEIAKIKLKIQNDLLFDLQIISESSINIPEENNFGRPSLLRKASPLDHQATGNFKQDTTRGGNINRSNTMPYIGNKPPDPIQLELLEKTKIILQHLQNQARPKPEVHNHISDTLPDASKEAEIHDHPPSPATRKTKVLNRMEDYYRACVKKNGNKLIRYGVFKKTEEFQKILEWGNKEHGVTVEEKSIRDRMRDVNSELEISKLGASTASERKSKIKDWYYG